MRTLETVLVQDVMFTTVVPCTESKLSELIRYSDFLYQDISFQYGFPGAKIVARMYAFPGSRVGRIHVVFRARAGPPMTRASKDPSGYAPQY